MGSERKEDDSFDPKNARKRNGCEQGTTDC